MSTQGRFFAFTLNNYESTQVPSQLLLDCQYGGWGEEKAPETGTPHLQGFLYMFKKITLRGMVRKNYFGQKKPHYELCRGTLQANIAYCKKDGKFTEFGVAPADPGEIGRRMETDRWARLRDMATAPTFDLAAIADAYPREAVFSFNRLEAYRLRMRPCAQPRDVLVNYWIVGTTGVGKTRKAKTYGDWYVWKGKRFYPPFEYQPVLIVDEVTPGRIPFEIMSEIADHDPFTPEIMYMSPPSYRPAIVVVTSNYTIQQVYPRDFAAIARRFTIVQL